MYDAEKRVALVKSEWQNTTAGRCSEAPQAVCPVPPVIFGPGWSGRHGAGSADGCSRNIRSNFAA